MFFAKRTTHDDPRLNELREHVHRMRLILPVISVSVMALNRQDVEADAHPATPAAGGAFMNPQQLPPEVKPCGKSRRVTVGYACTDTPGVDVPYLRLRGRWLQDAGFAIGRRVKVGVSEGQVAIVQVD